ncbi:MAG: carboxypeptidase regulatory-like domain-containing protein, partial [Nitrosopumilaceae archaeon]|nr:carboxypeptidase regulatory-like domain-containing protein [Nitrosopumilaceae archaeon]
LVLLITISVHCVSAQLQQLSMIIKTENIFYDGETPIITGKILDQSKKPVSDVQLQVQFDSETVETKSKSDGSFRIASTVPATVGEYGISIIASKPDYALMIIPIEYSVVEKPVEKAPANITKAPNADSIAANGIINNPIAQILAKQLESLQKQETLPRNQTNQQNDTLGEQRKIAKESIEQDLVRMDKDVEYYNPFNAFSRFVADFDSSVKNIFWGEFEVTQKQHHEGQKAKTDALENGQSYKEATKAYQEKAKIGRDRIVELNNKINAGSNTNRTGVY